MKFAHKWRSASCARAAAIALLVFFGFADFTPRTAAQNPDTMMPEASAAKAKQLLARMIEAMGGQAYMNAREMQCSGRLSNFGHSGDLTAYIEFKAYWRFPDKHRIEYGKKGNIVDVFSGKEGWTMDHGGVSDEPADKIDEFQDRLLKSAEQIVRYRLKEPDMMFRYGGEDLIDLRPVDWVELTDRDDHRYRIAVQRDNHMLVRFKVTTEDKVDRELNDEMTSYANYHPIDGVQTPLQVARTRNDRKVFQAFYDTCTYKPNLEANFFTKAALEQRFQEVGSRADKKKAAKAN
jgi:hypothetical protein